LDEPFSGVGLSSKIHEDQQGINEVTEEDVEMKYEEPRISQRRRSVPDDQVLKC
jgi:hypothetical protein